MSESMRRQSFVIGLLALAFGAFLLLKIFELLVSTGLARL